jgi:hypothetical protein
MPSTSRPQFWLTALLAAALLAFSLPSIAFAATGRTAHRHAKRHRRPSVRHHSSPQKAAAPAKAVSPGLTFGIYPGGAAGTVGPGGALKPENPALRLAALEQLRAAGRPFVLHLYASYTAPGGWSAAQQVGQEVQQYVAAGFEIELVLTYRPSSGGSSADVAGFDQFVRGTVHDLGGELAYLQVTNEANVVNAPNAADGYYAGAKDALITGVTAAKSEAIADGFSGIAIGFNWALATDAAESAFWSYLGAHGGSTFVSSLDWVGLDAYPGTWGPSIGTNLTVGTASAIDYALAALRRTYMPLAGIPNSTPLHVSENGYPTGPGRTEAMQETAMLAAISTIDAVRTTYNVTDYRWFDLRDADSASSSFEDQYGLMHDDYTPKPAFALYRQLIAKLSAAH